MNQPGVGVIYRCIPHPTTLVEAVTEVTSKGKPVLIVVAREMTAQMLFNKVGAIPGVSVVVYQTGRTPIDWDGLEAIDAYVSYQIYVDDDVKYGNHFHLFRDAIHFDAGKEV